MRPQGVGLPSSEEASSHGTRSATNAFAFRREIARAQQTSRLHQWDGALAFSSSLKSSVSWGASNPCTAWLARATVFNMSSDVLGEPMLSRWELHTVEALVALMGVSDK